MPIDLTRYERFAAHGGVRFDERHGGVLLATLEPPERWNAIPMALHDSLPGLFAEIADDRSTAAFVLTGTGAVFSSGGAVDEIPQRSAAEIVELHRIAMRIITRLLEIPQPTMAIVNGPAIGFAANLALAFDFIVAASDAWFSDPHVAFGAVPGDGATLIWPRLLAPAKAKEHLLTGARLSADEAERFGLVNRVANSGDLEQVAFELLGTVLAMAPLAVRLGKVVMNAPLRAEAETTLALSLAAEMISLQSDDFKRATDAFRRTGRFDQDWTGT